MNVCSAVSVVVFEVCIDLDITFACPLSSVRKSTTTLLSYWLLEENIAVTIDGCQEMNTYCYSNATKWTTSSWTTSTVKLNHTQGPHRYPIIAVFLNQYHPLLCDVTVNERCSNQALYTNIRN